MRISDWSSDVCSSDRHGAVDVTQKGSRAGASTLRLQPGGIIVVEPKAQPRLIQGKADAPEAWPKGMMEFHRAPLGDVLVQVNRYAVAKIRRSDPNLGKIETGGDFLTDHAEHRNTRVTGNGVTVRMATGCP